MKIGSILQNVLTGTLVVCAVIVTALVVRREFIPSDAPADEAEVSTLVPEWREYAATGHRAGPAGATLTIVEFSDFQCPFCRALAARLDSLRTEYPNDVAVVYRHFPLRGHPHAAAAALASECAGDQGSFWQMHDALFQDQDSIGSIPWTRFAAEAGVADSAAFSNCMQQVDRPSLNADAAAGKRLRVDRTPTLLINERRGTGTPPLDTLRAYIQQALDRNRQVSHP